MPRRFRAWWRSQSHRGEVTPVGTEVVEPANPPPPYARQDSPHTNTGASEGQTGPTPSVNVIIFPTYEDELACLSSCSEDPIHVIAIAAAIREGCAAAAETVAKMFPEGRYEDELDEEIHEGRSKVAEAVLTAAAAAPANKEPTTAVIAADAITKVAYEAARSSKMLMATSVAAAITSTAHGMAANIVAFGALKRYRLSDVPRPPLTSVFTQKQERRGPFPH